MAVFILASLILYIDLSVELNTVVTKHAKLHRAIKLGIIKKLIWGFFLGYS